MYLDSWPAFRETNTSIDWVVNAESTTDLDHGAVQYFFTTSLVVGLNPSEKYDFVNWDDDIFPTEWENKIDGNQTTNSYRERVLFRKMLYNVLYTWWSIQKSMTLINLYHVQLQPCNDSHHA